MTTHEVMAYADISRPTFFKLLREDKLQRSGVRSGGQVTVTKASVDRLLGLVPEEKTAA
jgi:hypothetical protein